MKKHHNKITKIIRIVQNMSQCELSQKREVIVSAFAGAHTSPICYFVLLFTELLQN